MAVLKDGEDANDFAGEFFAFDHGDVPRCDKARVGQSALSRYTAPKVLYAARNILAVPQ